METGKKYPKKRNISDQAAVCGPVVIRECPDYSPEHTKEALSFCLEKIGGLSFVRPGMVIAVKANLVHGMDPAKGGTTHPQLLRSLAELLTEKGAEVIIGDSPGGVFSKLYVEGVYRACRMNEALVPGVRLNDDYSVKEAVFPEASSLRSFRYTGWLDQADAVINFAKLKTHGMMTMTGSVKNMFGVIPGTTKPEYHMRFPDPTLFADMLTDLNEYFVPELNLVDAVVGMEGNGPTAGEPRHMGMILASSSPHVLDLVCAALLGLGPEDVPTIAAGIRRGLCPKDIREVTVLGDMKAFMQKDLRLCTDRRSITFAGKGPFGKAFSAAGQWMLKTRPEVRKKLCVGCGKCAGICPAHAITMKNSLPDIDRKKCIRCFCCQEFCPKGAMRVRKNPVSRIVAGIGNG